MTYVFGNETGKHMQGQKVDTNGRGPNYMHLLQHFFFLVAFQFLKFCKSRDSECVRKKRIV